MKKLKFFILLTILFLFISNIPIATARVEQPTIKIPTYIQWFYPRDEAEITLVIISIVIFLMLAFAFSDIFRLFTTFGTIASAVLGTGLAVIVALTQGLFWFSYWVFQITAGLGVLAVAIILLTAFVAAVAVHLGSTKLARWVMRRKIIIEATKKAEDVGSAWIKLREFEKITK